MHWALTSIKNGNHFGLRAGMVSTFCLGLTFLSIQVNEYIHLGLAPTDSAQASIFYGLTGLHGCHVFIGLCLLAIVTVRSFKGHYSPRTTVASKCQGSTGTSSTSCGSSCSARSTSCRRRGRAEPAAVRG